jgi:hypothetical protein
MFSRKLSLRIVAIRLILACIITIPIQTGFAQQCTVPPPNLVGWWTGDGDFADIKGSSAATNAGGVGFTAGKVAQSFHFDGSANSYLTLPNAPELSPTAEITISAWVKSDPSASNLQDSVLIKRDGCGSQRSYHLSITKQAFPSSQFPGQIMAPGTVVWSPSVAGDDLESTTPFPPDGQFHHLAGTYNGSYSRIYIDGVLAGERAHTGPVPVTSDSPVMGINAACGHLTYGDLDEVQLYNRGLTASEIHSLFLSGSAGQCKGKYLAIVQQPVDSNGTSVFSANRGVVPLKFTLTVGGSATCNLPPAAIVLNRSVNNSLSPVDESEYLLASDTGSNFRISGCEYIYNIAVKSLGTGTYIAEIRIDNARVGLANFELK